MSDEQPKNGTCRCIEMSRRLRILADTGSITAAILAGLRSGRLTVLMFAALRDLGRELGGEEAALQWLRRQVNTARWPIMVNIGKADGSSDTIVLGPNDWSRDKLRGWAAPHLAALEAEFGPATEMTP